MLGLHRSEKTVMRNSHIYIIVDARQHGERIVWHEAVDGQVEASRARAQWADIA